MCLAQLLKNHEDMRISIVGLGWLGEPLAKYLLLRGYEVQGSTTTSEKANLLKEKGITAYPFFLNPGPEGEGWESLFFSDILIINIPPRSGGRTEDFHLHKIRPQGSRLVKNRVARGIFIAVTSFNRT